MVYKEDYLKKYIRLAVRVGAAVQPGQKLVLRSPVECAYIARLIVDEAYDAGAKDVILNWTDDAVSRSQFFHAADDVFDVYPPWTKLMYNSLSEENTAFMSISASNPEALKGADIGRISRAQKAANVALRPYYDKLMSDKIQWCVLSVPTKAWAEKVFRGTAKTAIAHMWDAIFAAARIDENDPVENWRTHSEDLKTLANRLTEFGFSALRFENTLGTNITVGLPKNHVWHGGGGVSEAGQKFLPNIPTEEIFTAPDRSGANGTVVSTMPLVYGGNVIENFSFTFKNGCVTDFTAKKNRKLLEKMLSVCKNMDRLGEVALVPASSPISLMNTLFYNTLYDENASSHLALGEAYADCVKSGEEMKSSERKRAGLNISDSHVDFMIGSKDMNVTGITLDGKEITVMKEGEFAMQEV